MPQVNEIADIWEQENLIMGNPSAFWGMKGAGPTHAGAGWSMEDVEEYQKWFFTSEAVHGVSQITTRSSINQPRS
jgi:hypothetical protein